MGQIAGMLTVAICLFGVCFVETATAEEKSAAPEPTAFAARIVPFLQKHCLSCHGDDSPEGGLSFVKYRDSANVQTDYELWEHVVRLLNERQMPPADEPQPTPKETAAVVIAIRDELAKFDCSAAQHPGRVTIRRLNKVEYNNTIRDLLGLDFNPADDFPSDDVGEGFDNIGDVLTIPPILMEKYLAAAEEIATRALADETAPRPHAGGRQQASRDRDPKRARVCRAGLSATDRRRGSSAVVRDHAVRV
jgi:mono/diheme cytochrome c family protein